MTNDKCRSSLIRPCGPTARDQPMQTHESCSLHPIGGFPNVTGSCCRPLPVGLWSQGGPSPAPYRPVSLHLVSPYQGSLCPSFTWPFHPQCIGQMTMGPWGSELQQRRHYLRKQGTRRKTPDLAHVHGSQPGGPHAGLQLRSVVVKSYEPHALEEKGLTADNHCMYNVQSYHALKGTDITALTKPHCKP